MKNAHYQICIGLVSGNYCKKEPRSPLSEAEATQLENLIQEEESLQVKRVEILGKLAQLKGVTLQQVVEELDIQPLK